MQLTFSTFGIIKSLVDIPLTLLRLNETMNDHIFKKVKLLHEIVKNGIMDFLVGNENETEHGKMIFGPEFYNGMD